MKSILKNRSGFTLIELIIVIVILGVLATLVGPKMIGSIKNSKVNTTISNIQAIERAASQYFAENGQAPDQAKIDGVLNKKVESMGMAFTATPTAGVAGANATLDISITIYGAGSTPPGTTTKVDVTQADLETQGSKLKGTFTAGAAGTFTYTNTVN